MCRQACNINTASLSILKLYEKKNKHVDKSGAMVPPYNQKRLPPFALTLIVPLVN